MKFAAKFFVTLMWLATTIFLTTFANEELTVLVDENIKEIYEYGESIITLIESYDGDDIFELGQELINLKNHNVAIQRLQSQQQNIMAETECVCNTSWCEKYSKLYNSILERKDKHYHQFENYFLDNQQRDILETNFTTFADLILFDNLRNEFLNSYVRLVNRTSTSLRNSLFDVLHDGLNPKEKCGVQSVNKLFADMAGLYALVFTKQYAMVALSARASQVPELQRDMKAVRVLKFTSTHGFKAFIIELHEYYKTAITTVHISVMKAFND